MTMGLAWGGLTPHQQSLRLRKCIGQQHLMHACVVACWLEERHKIHRVDFGSLVQQLKKRMLAVCACLSPNHCACGPRHRQAVSAHTFAIAFHVSLLEIS